MQRDLKRQFVTSVNQQLNDVNAVILTHYHGLTVEKLTNLRNQMRQIGAGYKIMKNSLAKIALQGTEFEQLKDLFSGPVGVIFTNDGVSLTKALVKFAKENDKLKIIGGMIDKSFVDEKSIKQLSELPSLDELRAKIAGLLNRPASKLISVLIAPGEQVARVIDAKSKK